MMGTTLTESALRAIYLVIIARFISAEDYGLWAYGLASYGLAAGLVIFGFNFLIATRIGANRDGRASFIGMTLVLRLALLGLAGLGLAFYAFVAEPPGDARTVLLVLLPALIGRGMALWTRTCFLAHERLAAYLPVSVTLRGLEVGLGVLWLVEGGGLMGIVVLHAGVWLIEGIAGVIMTGRSLTPLRFEFSVNDALSFLREGAVLGLAGALGIWLTMSPLVLLRQSGAEFALIGELGLALNIAMIFVACAQGFLGTALPVLSRSLRRGDKRLASYGRITALVVLSGAAVAGVVGLALGPAAAAFAFGPNFATTGVLLGPCLFTGGLILAPAGYAQLMAAKGKRWPAVVANATASIALILFIGPAVEAEGGLGAVAVIATAWAIRAILVVTLAIWLERHGGEPD